MAPFYKMLVGGLAEVIFYFTPLILDLATYINLLDSCFMLLCYSSPALTRHLKDLSSLIRGAALLLFDSASYSIPLLCDSIVFDPSTYSPPLPYAAILTLYCACGNLKKSVHWKVLN